ncbi:MAG: hypothetical protein ACREEM_39045 [Blastocatellia bacterium]
MSELVTLKISEQVLHVASRIALQKQRQMEDVLSDLLEATVNERPVESLSDEEVIALSEMKLSDEQDAALSDLLARQREDQLDEGGRHQLAELMHLYEKRLLRKAQALRVAVERGLRPPLRF